jgi:hypothetical protein
MNPDNLTEEEKQQFIKENLENCNVELNFSNFEKFKNEIESNQYNEYIEWEINYLKRCKDIGYINNNNNIQAEICEYCRTYGEAKLFDTQSKLLKHITICKHNPTNIKNMVKINVNCIYCNRYMGNEHNLNLHQEKCKNTYIPKTTTYNCEYCQKSCGNNHNLLIHQEKCKNIIKCQYCQKVLKSQLLIPTHLENCDSYIAHLQNLQSPINLDDIPDVNLKILVKNALK